MKKITFLMSALLFTMMSLAATEPTTPTMGLFSVGEGKQVTFSKGNLQYTRSTDTWSFAENQWDIIGTDNVTNGVLADKIDLFGWSTSTNDFGVSTSTNDADYAGDFVDWGTSQIGADDPNTWRTLTYGEWFYLIQGRDNYSSLYGIAQVNGVNGFILLPDNWTRPDGVTFKSGFSSESSAEAYGKYQTYTAEEWSKLESAGAVFLPASGARSGSNVSGTQNYGQYWSSSNYLGYVYISTFSPAPSVYYDFRYYGRSVRLVKDVVEGTTTPEEPTVDSTMIITYTSTDGNIVTPYNAEAFGANIVSNTYENGVGTITFDAPVTSIGDYAFRDCTSLTSITIPNSVTSIGNHAFSGCSGLTSVTIPESVTSIGEWAFSSCSSLTSVTIPNSVTSIGNYAFIGCTSLTSITIPNSVTSIGNNAFIGCTSLTSMVVETGNTIYDSRDNCNAIIETATNSLIAGCQNTIIPNSVTSIGERAFQDCSFLASITIPNSVTSIGKRAFSNCSSLASVTIPNSVTSIGDEAFYYCSSLTSITIPNSVTSIGARAFYLCTSLTSITIPNSVTSIGKSAFLSGNSLTSIILTGSTIESFCQSTTNKQLYNAGAYYNRKIELNNQEINDLIIPNSVTSIEDYAFYNCSSLASVTIPNSVTSIGEWAFSNCSSLDTIYVEASTPPAFGVEVFTNAPISTCYIPCLTTAAYEASDWAQYMGEFVEDCEQCGDSLYWKYKDTQLSIMGYGDMYDYDIKAQPWQQYRNKMQTTSLPEGLTSIGAAAFADCKFLKNATIPSSVKEIRYSAFEDCRSLSSLTFVEPSALTSIGNWAFYNCHKLQHVTIPEGVTEIGEAAFFDCTYLDELTLPASMEYIADNGFALCAKLRRMNVNATTPPQVEARTFEDVDRTIPVVVPDESVSVYKSAPVWQEFNIVGKSGVPAALDNIPAENSATRKLLRDGNLVIIRDGVEYNVMGQEL